MQEVFNAEGDGAAVNGRVVVQRAIVRNVGAHGKRHGLRLERHEEILQGKQNRSCVDLFETNIPRYVLRQQDEQSCGMGLPTVTHNSSRSLSVLNGKSVRIV